MPLEEAETMVQAALVTAIALNTGVESTSRPRTAEDGRPAASSSAEAVDAAAAAEEGVDVGGEIFADVSLLGVESMPPRTSGGDPMHAVLGTLEGTSPPGGNTGEPTWGADGSMQTAGGGGSGFGGISQQQQQQQQQQHLQRQQQQQQQRQSATESMGNTTPRSLPPMAPQPDASAMEPFSLPKWPPTVGLYAANPTGTMNYSVATRSGMPLTPSGFTWCARTTHSDVTCIMNTTRIFREQVPEIAPPGSNKGTFKQQKERLCRLPYAGGKGSGLVKVAAAPATTLFAQQRAARSHAKTCRQLVAERDEFMAVSALFK